MKYNYFVRAWNHYFPVDSDNYVFKNHTLDTRKKTLLILLIFCTYRFGQVHDNDFANSLQKKKKSKK